MSFNVTDEQPAAQKYQPIDRQFHPLDDRVLVMRIDPPEAAGMIVLPDCAAVPSKWGVVVELGPGRRMGRGRRPIDLAIGDVIMFGRYTDYDDSNLLIIQEADVVGVMR